MPTSRSNFTAPKLISTEGNVVRLHSAVSGSWGSPNHQQGFTKDQTGDTNSDMSDQITRNEFNAEIKAIEARIDSKIADIRGDFKAYMAEGRERDKRLELIATSAEKAAASASNLKGHLWAACIAVIIAVLGTVVAAYFATQQSNIGITQSVISAFQQGQSSQPPPPLPAKK